MKFNLVDKVEHLSDERIVTVKFVTLAEEYLADHFPSFPVLPGVLMLEAAVQSGAWLMRHRTDFSRSMCVLREAHNVKYGKFVAPGNFLRMELELVKASDGAGLFKATGTVHGEQAVQMRLELSQFNLSEHNPELAAIDERLRENHRKQWDLVRPAALPAPLSAARA